MATRVARIKAHTRTSKNGKTYNVRAHGRSVSLTEMLKANFSKPSMKKIAWGTVGASTLAGLFSLFSTAMSVAAALIWAILMVCMVIVTFMLMTKPERRAQRRKWRHSASLSMQRRVKLWAHHNVVAIKTPRKRN